MVGLEAVLGCWWSWPYKLVPAQAEVMSPAHLGVTLTMDRSVDDRLEYKEKPE